jgi:hypothetical protein
VEPTGPSSRVRPENQRQFCLSLIAGLRGSDVYGI